VTVRFDRHPLRHLIVFPSIADAMAARTTEDAASTDLAAGPALSPGRE